MIDVMYVGVKNDDQEQRCAVYRNVVVDFVRRANIES